MRANGATKVDTVAAARLPTASTPITTARLRAVPDFAAAGAGDPEAAPVGSLRQNHAPARPTTAEIRNSGRAPNRAAIGSATAGPSALVASATAP